MKITSAKQIITCDGDIVWVAELVRDADVGVGKASRAGVRRLVNEIVGDGDGSGRIRNINRVAVRSCQISLAGHVVAGNNALLNCNRVSWRIQKSVVLDGYAQSRGNPDVLLGGRLTAYESTILHCGAAESAPLIHGPKTGRAGKRAVFDCNIVSVNDHRGVAEIDAAKHSAGLIDVYDVCGWGIIVGRVRVLADFRDVEQRRRGVRIAGHRIDARQNGARIIVSNRLNLCG